MSACNPCSALRPTATRSPSSVRTTPSTRSLYDKLPFNFIRDSAPVAGLIRLANAMEMHPAVPANKVAEFIAHAKANPGKINFASGGVGTSPHLSGELLKMMTGINLVHVPYRGTAPALIDLM